MVARPYIGGIERDPARLSKRPSGTDDNQKRCSDETDDVAGCTTFALRPAGDIVTFAVIDINHLNHTRTRMNGTEANTSLDR